MIPIFRRILAAGWRSEALPPPAPASEADFKADAKADSSANADPDAVLLGLEIRRRLGRALCIRAVDAGSCNACELEIHALNNAYYNLEGAGIKFVASPRHADLLLVTGPVARNMEVALRRTYDATPEPKLVVAVGDCACTGGIFGESYASCGRVANVIPVDATVAGCPPSPRALLQAILGVIGAPPGGG